MTSQTLKSVYMAQRAALRRFLAARLRNDAAAEDLVQELWIRVCAAQPREPVDNPANYLFTMAGRLALDHIRQHQRRQARDEKWTDENTSKTGAYATSQEDDGETALLRAEGIDKVRAAIARLPPKARKVFEMHRIQGLPHKQIAAELGIAVSTVEKHIIRAMRELTMTLRDSEP